MRWTSKPWLLRIRRAVARATESVGELRGQLRDPIGDGAHPISAHRDGAGVLRSHSLADDSNVCPVQRSYMSVPRISTSEFI